MGDKGVAVIYDKEYYETQLGPIPCYPGQPDWEKHWEALAKEIARLNPRHVIEAGCAFGMLVKHLRARGVDATGFDVSEYAIGMADSIYCTLGDVRTFEVGFRRDLAICIEILEHLEYGDVLVAIENLCRMSDVILFSSDPEDDETESHLTVLSINEWDDLFAEHGYMPVPSTVAIMVSEHARMYMKRRVR